MIALTACAIYVYLIKIRHSVYPILVALKRMAFEEGAI